MSRKEKTEDKRKTTRHLFLVIVLLILVPIILHQIDFGSENVKMAGRICAGAALLLLIVGLIKNMVKIFALTLAALILVMILASEGIIDIPKLFSG
jgi:hypothetical protein